MLFINILLPVFIVYLVQWVYIICGLMGLPPRTNKWPPVDKCTFKEAVKYAWDDMIPSTVCMLIGFLIVSTIEVIKLCA